MSIMTTQRVGVGHLCDWPGPDLLAGGSVVTLGVFDGFHRGHQELVARARRRADELSLPCVLVTFDPHPRVLTSPDGPPRPLLTVEQRVDIARRLGIDHVVVLPFDVALAATPATDFVAAGLVARLHARYVVVGVNFRFGCRGVGDPTLLARLGWQHGYDVDSVEMITRHGLTCSSTEVRRLLAHGDLAAARDLLGHTEPLLPACIHPPDTMGLKSRT